MYYLISNEIYEVILNKIKLTSQGRELLNKTVSGDREYKARFGRTMNQLGELESMLGLMSS